jgi:hypothetical protein
VANTLFDVAAEILEGHTCFNRLEARGTLRIALKAAGLEPDFVTAEQLQVVLEKVMPSELEKRDVRDAKAVCVAVTAAIASTPVPTEADGAVDLDGVFGRLGGD